MKLKRILEQTQLEQKYRELDEYLEGDDFIFQEPFIYRGTENITPDIFVKDVSGRTGREPRDAEDLVDSIINDFYIQCFPDLPKRRESSFATAYEGDAEHFGRVYAVFPHKNANITHSSIEPYDLFIEMSGYIEELKTVWEDHSTEIVDWFQSKFGSHTSEPLFDIAGYLSGKDQRGFEANNLMCPKELLSYIMKFQEDHTNALTMTKGPSKLVYTTNHIIYRIRKYFKNLDSGYPSNKDKASEVVIDGKYLQVEYTFFHQYLDNHLS